MKPEFQSQYVFEHPIDGRDLSDLVAYIEQSRPLKEYFQWVYAVAINCLYKAYQLTDPVGKDNKTRDEIIEMILSKMVHTWEVIIAAWDIATAEGEKGGRLEQVIAAANLHDVWRFFQALLHGTFSDKNSVDHGFKGFNLFLLRAPFVVSLSTFLRLGLAIKDHNGKDYEKSPEAFVTAYTRDADKLALIRVDNGITENINQIPEAEFVVSPKVFDAFISEQLVVNGDGKKGNIADKLMGRLAWIWDLEHQSTRRFFVQEGHVDRMLEGLARALGPESEQYRRIEAKVFEWKTLHSLT